MELNLILLHESEHTTLSRSQWVETTHSVYGPVALCVLCAYEIAFQCFHVSWSGNHIFVPAKCIHAHFQRPAISGKSLKIVAFTFVDIACCWNACPETRTLVIIPELFAFLKVFRPWRHADHRSRHLRNVTLKLFWAKFVVIESGKRTAKEYPHFTAPLS